MPGTLWSFASALGGEWNDIPVILPPHWGGFGVVIWGVANSSRAFRSALGTGTMQTYVPGP